MEVASVKVERFGPERLERRPLVERIRSDEIDRAEPPRIVEREPLTSVGLEQKVIVLPERRVVDPQEKTRRVGAVFSSVARRYDVMNDLMSGGMHRLWKDRFVARVKPRPGEDILDMAGGTGDVAFRLARRGAQVTVADINPDMLEVGKERAEKRGLSGLRWKVENAETLSFANASFDAYTIVFGIRNVTNIGAALSEAHRVLKRGGRFYCMEFSTSDWPGFSQLYDRWADKIIPRIGKAVADDEDSYRYLVESIRRFPRPEVFRTMITDAGFVRAAAEPMLGALVSIHSGWKI